MLNASKLIMGSLLYGVILTLALVIQSDLNKADTLPNCKAEDFHYEYTQCDSSGGRWRVSVPNPGTCVGGSPNAPVRGKGCDFTCQAGEYLDIDNDQECHPCPAGHFSLGGGVRFEDFDGEIPKGFHTEMEQFSNLAPYQFQTYLGVVKSNCSGAGWYAKDDQLYADVHDCTASLTYRADLVQPGVVTFIYQNEDEETFFSFEIKNSQCQSALDPESGGFLKTTKRGALERMTFDLKTGSNTLYWRAFRPTIPLLSRRRPMPGPKSSLPTLSIRSIDITGVAYTSNCTQCKAGTYSLAGSAYCTPCPVNTFSSKSAKECFKCDISEYADEGSENCKTRPACGEQDYYEYNSPCDVNNQTQKLYRWIEPQLCWPQLQNSLPLPLSGPLEPCPPCNPGMVALNGSCRFCPSNHFSTGSGPCQECPGSTSPQTGLIYQWWNSLNPEYNITANCLSDRDRGCASREGWIPSGDHINSGQGHSTDVYLMLSLRVGGFKGQEMVLGGKLQPVAKISFLFELNCDSECRMTFMQRNARDGMTMIESWSGSLLKKTWFEYDITRTGPATFTWSFQKSSEPTRHQAAPLSNSIAKIYMINVTNTVVGGAQECRPCPKGASQDGCIPCPAGYYISHNTTRCTPCPPGSITRGLNPWGEESCVECGAGLTPSTDRTHCVTSCRYESVKGRQHDFSPLARLTSLNGSKLFTSSGYKYYNQFRVSLCGGNNIFPLASCASNISKELLEYEDEILHVVESPVCRVTILPSSTQQAASDLYTQHISLGDTLVAVTEDSSLYNISKHKQEAGFDDKDSTNDVYFVYASDSTSPVCPDGLRTIIVLRCDLEVPDLTRLSLPPQCVTGTCDGCNYVMLWRSRYACPKCSANNFTEFTDVCLNGKQKVLKIWPKDCYGEESTSTEEVIREQECSILWQDKWPLWLKAVVISIPVILVTGCILLAVVCHCWMKNKKLQYKYMKLVENSGPGRGGECELPPVETCGLDYDDEDDDQFDVVQFKTTGRKILGKIGAGLGRRKDRVGDLTMEPMDERTRLRGDER